MSKNIHLNSKSYCHGTSSSNGQRLKRTFPGTFFLQNALSNNTFVLVLIFFSVFVIHFSCANYPSSDSMSSIYTSMSIIKEGNTNLDEYEGIISKIPPHIVEKIDNHVYTVYPIGTSFLSTPIVFILDKFLSKIINIDLNKGINHFIPSGIEIFIGSIYIALSSVIIYLVCRLMLGGQGYSLLIVFIFAFCTGEMEQGWSCAFQRGLKIRKKENYRF